MSFIEKLDEKSMEVFNEASQRPFSQQCVFFLNAFWVEFGDQAEYIYSIINPLFRATEMNSKGIKYVHLYDEGNDVDFDMALYFFEQACKFVENPNHEFFKPLGLSQWAKEHANWADDYKKSAPEIQTAIQRKKELRERVDVNFDGRVSPLEYLLYQYNASPKDLIDRMETNTNEGEHEEIRKARMALEAVNKAIAEYEAEKHRLEEASELPGVKGMKAKNELAQLNSGPLWEKLNVALITAEAAVRMAIKRFGAGNAAAAGAAKPAGGAAAPGVRTDGALWWMKRDLEEKQKKYGAKNKDK